ncbi:MAG: AAA family ATPase [Haliscomenobacter sp.]|uniref:AAA family ATPase n=1 Tax=Haliscomenobacter sp. TaxID=2717303 RepID=UPI0029BBAA7F|nr:AAA family ATPase [Haliscomenobacter sp.]MDX2071806.1 AAA family ATPase [Haliscomenobacter sp.]
MINIPYGLSDFKSLRLENYFYQDRTLFIEQLEKWNSKYPVFLRPRRFGKSLFISTLHHYYGLEHKDLFLNLFGDLHIGQQPTALANTYLVLRFEFSRIDTTTHESTYQGFLKNVIEGTRTFLGAYHEFFNAEDTRTILEQQSPEAVVKTIFGITKARNIPHKIYLLVDEYDHFANELLSFDMVRFKADVSRNGFVRKFYESLKTAAGEGIVDRIFITGVSPITLDSLTSGFNISDNITLNPVFHDLMGFTHSEVEQMLHSSDIPLAKIPTMLSDLMDWYNGYFFTTDVHDRLFNPDMVLYFLKEYNVLKKYPYEMLDSNIISDYRKVRKYFRIGADETERFELLEALVKEGYVDFPLTRLYNIDAPFTQEDFLSLLFYLGILTVQEPRSSDWRFRIPNYVIKKLYFEYFTALFLEKTRFVRTHQPITKAIDTLVNDANPQAFLDIVEYVLAENHSNRDELSYGEKHLQTLMIGLFFPFKAFMIHSEYETGKNYPDIFLERVPDRMMNYEIVLELKYVKKSAEKNLPKVISQAEQQLDTYMRSERFSRPDVRGFYVVFLGGEVHQWKQWGK